MFEILKLYLGEKVQYNILSKRLTELGYQRTESITSRAEFSIKGNSITIYPSSYDFPVRLELDDNIVRSIKAYNYVTGDVLEEHGMLIVLPARINSTADRESVYLESFPISNFLDIEKGDYVVHVAHGIGRFLGIKKIDKEDFFLISYQDKDKLYIPLKDAHLLQRYAGFAGRAPKLSKLASREWQKTKNRAVKGIRSFAVDLLEIQAARSDRCGYAFSPDTEWQQELKRSFQFKDTPDQEKAIEEVVRDMESGYPMDRLICGDVGYGKTEVALRAAFKAVMDNKQVAMLVPTTLLAEQHYRRFLDRLRKFPVCVEMLSRFRTESEQNKIIKDISRGKVDIIIGTHRLLSDDVIFKDLGILIIDEEQRFGVIQKEKFKKYRQVVDVLTLSATPIPRTLYMSLLGIKDMSVINTPPEDRLPIETYLCEFDERIVERAIKMELDRGGQVFFVHNRINGIERVANQIKKLVPYAEVAVGHGRIAEKDLEDIMI
ncbi:MAG: CarD family transcriptional regulator, partial [Candidatus Omnitrophica bacterium]|nr:CarD family transcriptional regulator [Candidatus Omnitrophota bacterium]